MYPQDLEMLSLSERAKEEILKKYPIFTEIMDEVNIEKIKKFCSDHKNLELELKLNWGSIS